MLANERFPKIINKTLPVKWVTSWSNLLVREDSDPSKTCQEMFLLLSILESSLRADRPSEILLGVRFGAQNLRGCFLPGAWSLKEILLFIAQEAHVD